LERNGYRVLLATNGREGLDLFTPRKQDVTLVLTDLMMPAMDGRALARAVKEISPLTPVLGSSGLQQAFQKLSDDDDFVAVLSKPFSGAQLLEAIHSCLAHSADELVPAK